MSAAPAVLLFDGVCNLCNAVVRFVIRNDRPPVFRFAALQSEVGQRLLHQYSLPVSPPDGAPETFVMIESGRAYVRSSAALRMLRKLGLPWSILYVLILVPRPLRDAGYRWIARHRYGWFGRSESCMVPTPELRDRFLD